MNETLFADFLKTREILWVGINFAKSKFTREGFDFNQETLQHHLQEWNKLILNDQKKYDIRMSFRKPIMKYDLSVITKLNKSLKVNDVLTLFISSQHVYSDEQMRNYVASLELPATLPYALMFAVESFDTTVKTAAIWVVITKTDTREVVLCEKFLKKPAGIGLRNYWARTFYNVFYDIQSDAFRRWENMVQS
ncbi:MAG: hypothetical protein IKO09_05530 [Bacteroidales bacterium]|jgi:hypothetical protein|nr:hypothetical protein [Bacteroidales bacterium]